MAAGHIFEVMAYDLKAGLLIVRWDNDDDRRMTCRIPVAKDGGVQPEAEFRREIMTQCAPQLETWDATATVRAADVQRLIGRKFDVTEEFALRNVKTPPAAETEDEEFNLEDHL